MRCPSSRRLFQLLSKGFKTRPYRCTDGTVYSVVEGTGTTKDTFVVPSWVPLQIGLQSRAA
jgi:gentisate 1,2-dioxygenase